MSTAPKIYYMTFPNRDEALMFLNDPTNEVVSVTSMSMKNKVEVEATFYISDKKYQEIKNEEAAIAEAKDRKERVTGAKRYVHSWFRSFMIGFPGAAGYLTISKSETYIFPSKEDAWIECEQSKGKYSAVVGNVLHVGGKLTFVTSPLSSEIFINPTIIEDIKGIIEMTSVQTSKGVRRSGPRLVTSDEQVAFGISKGIIRRVGNTLNLDILGTKLIYEAVDINDPLWVSCNLVMDRTQSLIGHVIDMVSSLDEALARCKTDASCIGITRIYKPLESSYFEFQLRHRLGIDNLTYETLLAERSELEKKQSTMHDGVRRPGDQRPPAPRLGATTVHLNIKDMLCRSEM